MDYGSNHRNNRLARLTERRGINLRKCKRNQTDNNIGEIIFTRQHGQSEVAIRSLVKEGSDQQITKATDNSHAENTNHYANNQLYTESITYALYVAATVELGSKYSRTRNRTENRKVKYENKHIHNRNTRHLLRSERTNHKIVKQVNKIGNCVLYNHWNGDSKRPFVKRLVTDKTIKQIFNFHFFLNQNM